MGGDRYGSPYSDNWTTAHNGSGFTSGSSPQFRLQVEGVGTKTVPIPIPPFTGGWNLVGFTGVGENDTPNNVFAGLSYYMDYYIYYWIAPGGPYVIQDPNEVLKDNFGYWVWVKYDKPYETSGIRPASRDIHLLSGWNLVSFPAVDENTTPNNIFTGLNYYTDYYLYYWIAPGGPYEMQGPDQVFENHLGYWVWIDRNNVVTVP